MTENIPVYRNGIKIFGNEPLQTDSLMGDLNSDGKVNVEDYLKMKNYLVTKADSMDMSVWDINKDGKLNVLDLIALKKMISK